jgi:hypothetical protein
MGYESLDNDEQTAIQMPASMIRLLKQREGEGWIGDIGANFDSAHTSLSRVIKGPSIIWPANSKVNLILSGKPPTQRGIKMDRLIREMSYLFTKQRFLELQETAKDIAIGHSDFLSVSVLLLTPSLNLLKTLLMMSGESMKNPYALRCYACSDAVG